MKTAKNLDKQYLQKLENIDFQPVFILGLNRSGTSILYKMLTATQCFNSVTAYHIICYDQLIYNKINNKEEAAKDELTNSFREHGQTDRGIDKLEVTADFDEEYGFLFINRGYKLRITPRNLPLFVEMVKKIRFISGSNKPILLKNPYDFSNFLYIKQKMPNAKFVFIHRNPYHALSSLMKAERFLYHKKNPYAIRLNRPYKKLFENPPLLLIARASTTSFSPIEIILRTWISADETNYYLKKIEGLPKEDYVSITYEDLCKNPQKNIEKILKSLNIKPRSKIDYQSFIEPRKTDIDPSVKQMQGFIFKSMKNYFTKFNFSKEIE